MPVVVGEIEGGWTPLYTLRGGGVVSKGRIHQQTIYVLFKKNDTLKRDG